jgi:predicted secreted protein
METSLAKTHFSCFTQVLTPECRNYCNQGEDRKMSNMKDASGISNTVFVIGLIAAILASSLISAAIMTQLPTAIGPKGDKGDKGDTGDTGATGATGPQGPRGSGTPDYDSGWVNVTDKWGQSIVITHNLNSTDLTVDIQGKRKADSGPHQFLLGGDGMILEVGTTYGGTKDDAAYDLVKTADGGYALAGNGFANLVKTDANGTMQWNMTYEGDHRAAALVQTVDGGYALAGYTSSFDAGGGDFWLVKTYANGTAQWNKTYGGTGNDVASALVQTGDDGYALAGYKFSYGAGGDDFWLVKTDSNGNEQWNKTYGGTGNDHVSALVQTVDGGYAIAGNGFANLVKTDANGTMQWNMTYGGTNYVEAYALVQTADGGYALAGSTGGDFWLVKTDSNGNEQWNMIYGGTSEDYANALVQTADGGYAIAGQKVGDRVDLRGYKAWLVKTDSAGNALWNKTYGGTYGDDVAYALTQTGDGGYALAGYTYSFAVGAGYSDFWLVKTDQSGEPEVTRTRLTHGLAMLDSTENTITLLRGTDDVYWNYVRVRLWKPEQTP